MESRRTRRPARRRALRLVGWWMPADAARGVVLLLHDGASNRSFLWSNGLVLARGLHERGYRVLAPDLRGHGESDAAVRGGAARLH